MSFDFTRKNACTAVYKLHDTTNNGIVKESIHCTHRINYLDSKQVGNNIIWYTVVDKAQIYGMISSDFLYTESEIADCIMHNQEVL